MDSQDSRKLNGAGTLRAVGSLALIAAVFGAFPQIAVANVTCEFETTCPEGEVCGKGSHRVTILSEMDPFEVMELNRAVEPFVIYLPINDRFELEDGGIGKVNWLVNQANLAVSFSAENDFRLLSLAPGGDARLSVHTEQSSTVYLGRCLAG